MSELLLKAWLAFIIINHGRIQSILFPTQLPQLNYNSLLLIPNFSRVIYTTVRIGVKTICWRAK